MYKKPQDNLKGREIKQFFASKTLKTLKKFLTDVCHLPKLFVMDNESHKSAKHGATDLCLCFEKRFAQKIVQCVKWCDERFL